MPEIGFSVFRGDWIFDSVRRVAGCRKLDFVFFRKVAESGYQSQVNVFSQSRGIGEPEPGFCVFSQSRGVGVPETGFCVFRRVVESGYWSPVYVFSQSRGVGCQRLVFVFFLAESRSRGAGDWILCFFAETGFCVFFCRRGVGVPETGFCVFFAESRSRGAGTWILCFFAESGCRRLDLDFFKKRLDKTDALNILWTLNRIFSSNISCLFSF